MALTRLIVEPHDSLAWATVLHFIDGVGPTFVDQIYTDAKDERRTFAESLLANHQDRFDGFAKAPARKTQFAIDAIKVWLEDVALPSEMPENGWAQWLRNLPTLPLACLASEDLFDLVESVGQLIDDDINLGRFLNQLAPLGKDIANARADGVRIMSLTSSKGLTVRGTIIAGCEDGIIPREGQNRSEEARLMYVGMTRSREVLYCTWAQQRTGQTARAGRQNVGMPRRPSGFFEGGPVNSQRGDNLLT